MRQGKWKCSRGQNEKCGVLRISIVLISDVHESLFDLEFWLCSLPSWMWEEKPRVGMLNNPQTIAPCRSGWTVLQTQLSVQKKLRLAWNDRSTDNNCDVLMSLMKITGVQCFLVGLMLLPGPVPGVAPGCIPSSGRKSCTYALPFALIVCPQLSSWHVFCAAKCGHRWLLGISLGKR